MKTTHSKSKFTPLILATAFALFLLYGQLTGSDFIRGIKAPPPVRLQNSWDYWATMDSLNLNLVFNGRGVWLYPNTSLETYLTFLDSFDLQASLKHADYDLVNRQSWTDSLPYLVEHHSWGQYNQLQVEWNDSMAEYYLGYDGTGYYYWDHYQGNYDVVPGADAVWAALVDSCDADTLFVGIFETDDENHPWVMEPKYDYPAKPGYDFPAMGRTFLYRIRARADKSGLNPSDEIFSWTVRCEFDSTPGVYNDSWYEDIHTTYLADSFATSLDWQEFWVEKTLDTGVDTNYKKTKYYVEFADNADLWVDWIEYMDMDRAYYLFYVDPQTGEYAFRDSVLNQNPPVTLCTCK